MPAKRYAQESSAAVRSEVVGRPTTPPRYYGEPHKFDPFFRGPVRKRSCTDVLCCLIFMVVILAYGALGIVDDIIFDDITPLKTRTLVAERR
ncbi:unnamed protein product [Boreogadus saida]